MAGNSTTARAFTIAISIATLGCGKPVEKAIVVPAVPVGCVETETGCECSNTIDGSPTQPCSVASVAVAGSSAVCCAQFESDIDTITSCECVPFACMATSAPGGADCTCGPVAEGGQFVSTCTSEVCCLDATQATCSCGATAGPSAPTSPCAQGETQVPSCTLAMVSPSCATFPNEPTLVNDCRVVR